MTRVVILTAVPILLVAACIQTALPPVPVEEVGKPVAYLRDVAPILDRRCVVCHSCYNAGCQLNLASYEGLDRGGSKIQVYDTSRLTNQAPDSPLRRCRLDRRVADEGLPQRDGQ